MLRQNAGGLADGLGVDLGPGGGHLRFEAEVGIGGDEQLPGRHRLSGRAEAVAGLGLHARENARAGGHHVDRRAPVEHRLFFRPLAHDDDRAHPALLDRQPLELRDAQEHLVFQLLRLDGRAVGPEADAELLQLAQDLRRRDGLVALDSVEKDEFRHDHRRCGSREQQDRQPQPPLQPAEDGREAAPLLHMAFASGGADEAGHSRFIAP